MKTVHRLLVSATMLLGAWCHAGEAASPVAVATQAAPANGQAIFAGGPVSLATLAARRGGTDTASGAVLSAAVSGSTASNVTTGANSIADGAFAGMTGLPMVVQNSGNNVVIQTSTIINVTVK